jgi:dihydroxyacetone kinase-like protein
LEAGTFSAAALAKTAHEAAEATKPLKAIRGRASFLGDRSIGHMDPGARSSALLIETVAGILEKA